MTPKFKIDDIVQVKDAFSYNQADEATSIGKVIGVHMLRGTGVFRDKTPRILYTVSGISFVAHEEHLSLWAGGGE